MRSYMVALALLFIALGHPSFAQSEVATTEAAGAGAADADADGAADADALPIFKFDVNRPFALNCSPADGTDAVALDYSWSVNGSRVEQAPALAGRYKLEEGGAVFRLTARAHEDDFGNYSCSIGGAHARGWRVHARPLARLPPNSNVVEGQKLKLTCKLIGKPYPRVVWTYAASEDENGTEVSAVPALQGRVQLADSAAGVPAGELSLAEAQRGDAGVYRCAPAGAAPAETVLRVKDMYAALWPFLGICLEVFVLCAIILVYEKRRTKPETEDSDTDNHEQ